MKQKTRFLSILALLLMAVTGAVAQGGGDAAKYTKAVAISELKVGDILAQGASITGESSDWVKLDPNRSKAGNDVVGTEVGLNLTVSFGTNGTINNQFAPFTESGQDGDAWVVTNVVNQFGIYTVNLAGILMTGGTGDASTYSVTLASGTEDADKWTITPNSGLNAGDQVNIQYSGTKRIKSVTAVVKEAAPAPEGAISGKFTINNSGDQVYFSKGNLQAKIATYASNTATASEWKFADNQYTYIGKAAGNNSFAVGSWVDLFSWVGNSASNDTYGLITFDYPSSQANHGNVSGESLKTDWGTAAASNIGTGWRTLTKDEWRYLFGVENRIDVSGHARYRKYFRATVNSVQGIVLLPDNISGISDIPAESSRGTASTFGGKTYTTEAWAALESAGCIFLPAAGCRYGTTVYYAGTDAYYWSSTANGTDVYNVNFYSDTVNPANSDDRSVGYPVRLVYPVE